MGPKNLHFCAVPGDADATGRRTTLTHTGLKGLKCLIPFNVRKLLRPGVYLVFCLSPPWWKDKPRWQTMTIRTLLELITLESPPDWFPQNNWQLKKSWAFETKGSMAADLLILCPSPVLSILFWSTPWSLPYRYSSLGLLPCGFDLVSVSGSPGEEQSQQLVSFPSAAASFLVAPAVPVTICYQLQQGSLSSITSALSSLQ